MKTTVVLSFLVLGFANVCNAIQLSEDEFTQLHNDLNPTNETWKTIPWMTSLIEAQNISANQQKPLFIWAMDGHPLGCT